MVRSRLWYGATAVPLLASLGAVGCTVDIWQQPVNAKIPAVIQALLPMLQLFRSPALFVPVVLLILAIAWLKIPEQHRLKLSAGLLAAQLLLTSAYFYLFFIHLIVWPKEG